MAQTETRSIRVIAVMGVAAFLFLSMAALALRMLVARQAPTSQSVRAQSPFDSARAFADLESLLALGPRPSGSEGNDRTRDFIQAGLEQAGLKVWRQEFEAKRPGGRVGMANVVGVIEGDTPGVIVICCHYDSKLCPEAVCLGANDGGSATVLMLELARSWGPKRTGRSVWLCFFDGNESPGDMGGNDQLYGSRSFVEHLQNRNELATVQVVIAVAMVGDCELSLRRDNQGVGWIVSALWQTSRELNYADDFSLDGQALGEDQMPFRQAGKATALLVDPLMGRTADDHKKTIHTPGDSIDRVCPRSLQVVGDVVYHTLPKLDAHLDKNSGEMASEHR